MKSLLKKLIILSQLAMLSTGCQAMAAPSTAPVITADNAEQLSVVQQTQLSAPYNLAWSLDGSALLVLEGSGASRLDSKTLNTIEKFTFKTPVMTASVSRDGERLAYTEDESSITIVNIHEAETAFRINPAEMIGGLDFSPDGKTLLANSMETFTVWLWDARSGAERARLGGFETAAPVYSAKFGDDGRHILWIARGTAQIQEIASGDLGVEFSHEDFISDAALSPNGKVLAVAAAGTVRGEYTPALFLWDAASSEALGVLPYNEPFNRIAFSPDGRLIATANGTRITIWEVADPQQVADLDGGADSIRALAFSPDGTMLATAAADGTLALWRVK